MRTTIRWVDVAPYLKEGTQPVVLVERELVHGTSPKGQLFSIAEVARLGSFWVATAPLISSDNDPKWSLTAKDKYVRVPIHAYLTAARAKSHILATGMEIGIRAAMSYLQKVGKEPEELILIIGIQVDDLAPARNHFRCYVGVALKENNNPS
jgi:hypothetical protein